MRSTLLLALLLAGCSRADPDDRVAGRAPSEAPAPAVEEAGAMAADPGAKAAGGGPGSVTESRKSAPATRKAKKRAAAEPKAPGAPEEAAPIDEASVELERERAPDPIEAWYEALPESAIAYNRPDTVPFGQTFDVELFIDITGDAVATVQALDERREGNPNLVGETHSAPARTGDEVEVQLLGSNAIIDTLEPTSQLLTSRRPGHWHWRIRPAEPDDIVLTLHVMAIQPGRATGLKVKSYEDTIVVHVTTAQRARIWVADNWEWAWTFIVAPIGGWVFARMRRRRRRDGAETGEE